MMLTQLQDFRNQDKTILTKEREDFLRGGGNGIINSFLKSAVSSKWGSLVFLKLSGR